MTLLATRTGYAGSSDTSVTTSSGVDIPAGALVVLKFTGQEGGTVSSASDSASQSYDSAVSIGGAAILYKRDHPGGTGVTATITIGAAARYKSIVLEVHTDMDTSAGVLLDADSATGGATATVTTPSLSLSDIGTVTAVAVTSNDRSFTPDTGFTENYDRFAEDGAGTGGCGSQYRTGVAAGSITVTATASSSSGGMGIVAAAFKEAGAAATLTQVRFRWRNDDGSETTATWAAAEDANVTIPALTPTRLRVEIAATNDPASKAYRLQYRKVGETYWRDVN